MDNCFDLYLLSTIACRLSECLSEKELEALSSSLKALGEMLEVTLTHQRHCIKDHTSL